MFQREANALCIAMASADVPDMALMIPYIAFERPDYIGQ